MVASPLTDLRRSPHFYYEGCWVEKEDCHKIVEDGWAGAERDNIESVQGCISVCALHIGSWNKMQRMALRNEIRENKILLREAFDNL
ncbi:hypothetical protein ACOSQ3_015089 [Xanthoceras sorbifolium]